jgi:hypothetical protein
VKVVKLGGIFSHSIPLSARGSPLSGFSVEVSGELSDYRTTPRRHPVMRSMAAKSWRCRSQKDGKRGSKPSWKTVAGRNQSLSILRIAHHKAKDALAKNRVQEESVHLQHSADEAGTNQSTIALRCQPSDKSHKERNRLRPNQRAPSPVPKRLPYQHNTYNSYLLPSTVPRTHLRAFFLIISGWKFNAAQICSSSGNGVCLLLQQEINGLTVEVNDFYLTLMHVEVEMIRQLLLFCLCNECGSRDAVLSFS